MQRFLSVDYINQAVQAQRSSIHCLLVTVPRVVDQRACDVRDTGFRKPWTKASAMTLDDVPDQKATEELLYLLNSSFEEDLSDRRYSEDRSADVSELGQVEAVCTEDLVDDNEHNDWLLEELQSYAASNEQLLECTFAKLLVNQLKPKILKDPFDTKTPCLRDFQREDEHYDLSSSNHASGDEHAHCEDFLPDLIDSGSSDLLLEEALFSEIESHIATLWVDDELRKPKRHPLNEPLDAETVDITAIGASFGDTGPSPSTSYEVLLESIERGNECIPFTEINDNGISNVSSDLVDGALLEPPLVQIKKFHNVDTRVDKPWRKLPVYAISLDGVQFNF